MKKTLLSGLNAFIFDLDGTLIDSMPVWDKIYAAPFIKYDIDMPRDYILTVNHMGLDECVRYTLSSTPLPCGADELKGIWAAASLDEYALNIPLKEGAEELLTSLKERGIKIALATASPYELFVPCLKRLNVYSLFDLFVSTDDVSHGKDDPEIYLEAAKKKFLGDEVSHKYVSGLFSALAKKYLGLIVPRTGSGERFVLSERILRFLVLTLVPAQKHLSLDTFKQRVRAWHGFVFDAEGFEDAQRWLNGQTALFPTRCDSWLQDMLEDGNFLIHLSDACSLVQNPIAESREA